MNRNFNDWRNRRNQLNMTTLPPFGQMHYSIASYYTDTQTKTDMKTSFGEEVLFDKLHMIPDPLKKNLADTFITGENKKDPNYEVKPQVLNSVNMDRQRTDFYPSLSGITSFISGVFNVLSGTIFTKRAKSPPTQCHECFDASKPSWQPASDGDQNKSERAHHQADLNLDSNMSECRTAVAQCEDKLNSLRQLLSKKTVPSPTTRVRRPKKAFVEAGSVEDSFEDAFSPEDFVSIPNETYIKCSSPYNNQKSELFETDAPKMKTEIVPVHSNLDITVNHVETLDEPHLVKDNSCITLPKLNVQKNSIKPKNHKTNLKIKDKRFKNPSRECGKRQQSQLLRDIHEDMNFADEINSDISSAENSPQIKETFQMTDNCFDEIKGCFPSDDSFQIVFTDEPIFNRSRKISDCDSEDSFIVFEDSPDNCYTSTDVFGDTDISESEGSCDSDTDDETCNLPHSLSRSFGDLTDLSLYAVDEVDHVPIQPTIGNIEPQIDIPTNQCGLLLTEAKKQYRRSLPPKKVQFSEQPPEVHVMRVWAFAASQARVGHWEQFARDRDRFKRRIADVDMAVSWVLKPQHRSRVMFQRFRPWWNAEKRREMAEKKILEDEAGRDKNVVSVNESVNGLVEANTFNDNSGLINVDFKVNSGSINDSTDESGLKDPISGSINDSTNNSGLKNPISKVNSDLLDVDSGVNFGLINDSTDNTGLKDPISKVNSGLLDVDSGVNSGLINDAQNNTGLLNGNSTKDSPRLKNESKEIRIENINNEELNYKDVTVDGENGKVDDIKRKLKEIDLANVKNVNRLNNEIVNI